MNKVTVFFDKVARAVTSLAAVIVVMFLGITGMVFFSHTLFSRVFPDHMSEWEKTLATWTMALAWESTVLITTVNTKHINKRIPAIMAICSGIIVLFFIQAFDESLTLLELLQRWFVGILSAAMNYIYAELFYAKWKERQDSLTVPSQVIELQSRLDEAQRTVIEAESHLNQTQSRLDEKLLEFSDIANELTTLRAFKSKIELELVCPHCNEPQPGYGSLQAHKGHCPKNPRSTRHQNSI